MSWDMNSGYSGYSMSKRAVEAYRDGEMPRTKWTKSAMLAALAQYCEEESRVTVENVAKWTKSEIFEQLFYCSSWHHTSKFCNATDFYALDEDAAEEVTRAMTHQEVEAAREAEKVAREAEEAARAERLAKLQAEREAARAWCEENGCEPTSRMAYINAHPEKIVSTRTSAKGMMMYKVVEPNGKVSEWAAQDLKAYCGGFNALYDHH